MCSWTTLTPNHPKRNEHLVNHIFVYGTLRRGQGANRNFGMEKYAEFVKTCKLDGAAIYHLGGFPGLKFEEGSEVVGDLYKVIEPRLMGALDGYEGYRESDPAGSLYIRREIDIEGTKAYTYEYNHSIRDQAPRIASGDWCQAA